MSQKALTSRSNALVRACCLRLVLARLQVVRVNNQPIAHRVAGRLVGYRKRDPHTPLGLPDVWALAPNRLVLVECKTGDARLSKDQREFMTRAKSYGHLCVVIRDVRALDRLCSLAAAVGWAHVRQDSADEITGELVG